LLSLAPEPRCAGAWCFGWFDVLRWSAEAEDVAGGLEAEADALGGGAGLGGVLFLILRLGEALSDVEHQLVDGLEGVALGLLEFSCEVSGEVVDGDV
jgi:hypothetical protein